MTTETTRRAMLGATCAALAGGAALNAAAIVAAKATETGLENNPVSDPIFAAIERHRAAFDAVEASQYGSSEQEQDRLDAEVETVNAIRDQVLAAPVLTPAGMAAALRFLIEFELEPFDYTEHGEAFLQRLADSIERTKVAS